MFFYLSKIFYTLTLPFTVICLLFLAGMLLWNPVWKKRIRSLAFIMLFFLSNEFIANEVMRAWEVEAIPYNKMKNYKYGIVLTGATLPDREPDDRVYFARGADRVTHTVQLLRLGIIEKILISGGTGRIMEQERPEAEKFKDAMVLMGVPEENIVLENRSRNTGESAKEVQKLLYDLNADGGDCLLITSAFHMRRSLACFEKTGLEPDPFSTDFYSSERNFYIDTLLIPKLDAMVLWHKLSKEWIGMVAYKLAGYI